MGLKQIPPGGVDEDGISPQSNQRGIETLSPCVVFQDISDSLNRTSVGLKQEGFSENDPLYTWPQSNQRGIETPLERFNGSLVSSLPQSNQRGIETSVLGEGPKPATPASIEPAWD